MGIERQISASYASSALQLEIQALRHQSRCKTIHQSGWNIAEYCKIFQIPNTKMLEVTKWFLGKLNHSMGNEIKILCPGVGAGRNELALIMAMAEKYDQKQVICDFIDFSHQSCACLNAILTEFGFAIEKNRYVRSNIEITIHIEDFEDWLEHNNSKKFDVIFSFFLFNFLSNWRESIIKTIGLLEEDGILLVSQDLGDLCFLDNTFNDIPSKNDPSGRYMFFKLWRDYYEIRRRYGLDWNNLISPSNMHFVHTCFSEIHSLVCQDENISSEFYWDLTDLEGTDSLPLSTLSYWLTLIEGNVDSNRVFNCLDIPNRIGPNESIRKNIALELSSTYRSFCVTNLKFGEKMFYLKKPKQVSSINFNTICRYVFRQNNLNILRTTAYKFRNRNDNYTEATKVPLVNALQNRALDIYNCFIHSKDKAMVSMFSKEAKFQGNRIEYSWRQDDTPIVYPVTFSTDDIKYFLTSYSFYFLYKQMPKYNFQLTGLIHNDLLHRIGVIFCLNDSITNEIVRPIYYQNSSNIKALVITISKQRFEACQSIVRKYIANNACFNNLDYLFASSDVLSKNFTSTQFVGILMNKIVSLISNLDGVIDENVFESTNKGLPALITNCLSQEYDISLNVSQQIQGLFSNIYLIGLSHPVDCNVILYTTTNIDFSSEGADENREQSYYGLIIADRLPIGIDDNYIENYYDQLLSNTFSYSGMDGIHEQKVIEKVVKLNARKAAISQVMLRNMSHNIGSHVLSRMMHMDQIKDSQTNMHEGIRYILSKTVLDDEC